jgi:hypothetical protein
MRLDEDDIAFLKMLEKLDEFEEIIAAITGRPWRHPFKWWQARKMLAGIKEFRQELQNKTPPPPKQ